MKFISTLLLLCLILSSSSAQYLVYFKDKADYWKIPPQQFLSPEALQHKLQHHIPISISDYPIPLNYLSEIHKLTSISGQSKWLNFVLAPCNEITASIISKLYFVEKVVAYNPPKITPTVQNNITSKHGMTDNLPQLDMIGATDLHRMGFTGQGVRIAVFDNGYSYLNDLDCTSRLQSSGQIVLTHDFVDGDEMVYDVGGHGTMVMTQLAALDPGVLYGASPDAWYYLFRTEADGSETHQEEVNWLMAAEWADSLGVQIITSSLGYNTFDSGQVDYTYANMDGKTTLISIAAQMAADKGMLVVNSAGNEGSKPWRYITAPGDAEGVLTVGAVDQWGVRPQFSSVGPTSDGRIKPELVAMGSGNRSQWADGPRTIYGTSFSCPLIAGLAACLFQSNPSITSFQMKQYLIESGSQYLKPDTSTGYGIPSGVNVFQRITGKMPDLLGKDFESDYFNFSIFPNPALGQGLFFIDNTSGKYKDLFLEMWSMGGQLVASWKLNPPRYQRTYTLDFDQYGIASGCYFLKIGNGSEWISTKKLILL